jgi:3',5'-cyclic-AMP phosphodiesterase
MPNDRVVCWLHVGDLHITTEDADNYRDLQRIAGHLRRLPAGAADFVLLPGDIADDGTAGQFTLVRNALRDLPLPLHIVPGDHDFAQRSLDAFHAVLGAAPLPHARTIGAARCLFLDMVSAGTGGPDFRLSPDQLAWTARQIDDAEASGEDVLVFMHTYPADLRQGAERLAPLLARPHVRCVDMGHTHYNELANDGGTIYMATRSTGQVEEGPVGVSLAALDRHGVSWRFKPLASVWPFVLVTHPVDRRLAPDAAAPAPGPVRAKVLGDAPIETVSARIGNGPWQAMRRVEHTPGLWQLDADTDGTVTVRAQDAEGRTDEDSVTPVLPGWSPPPRARDGSDRDRIGAWPERHIPGTQLGPNRNGRQW